MVAVQTEMDSMRKKLQGMYSWIAIRQSGSKLLGYCPICTKHKDKLPPSRQRAWTEPFGVELYDKTYTIADINKAFVRL